jgi:hypothetical protein
MIVAEDDMDAIDRMTLDGNAVGGMLATMFGNDMTAVPGECAHCGTVSVLATMRAYVRAPGMVLRCPVCHGVVIRVVETPDMTYLDVTGIKVLRIAR